MYKTGIYLFTVLMLALITYSNAQTSKKMETNFNKEQQEVFSTIERMVNAFHKKNIEGVMACYDRNALILFEPQKPVVGTADLKREFLAAFEINPHYEFNGHEIYIAGNIATHVAPWTMKGTLPDGTPIEQSGLSIAVLQKQTDGSWIMVFDNPHGQFLMEK